MVVRRQLRADTRVEKLCHRLRDLAFEKGPGAQLPTVSTLCEELDVSRVTLRDALNLLEEEQILYRRPSRGIFVSPTIYHKTILILFDATELISESLSPFWALLWLRLEQEARRRESLKNELYTFHLVTQIVDRENSLPEDIRAMLQSERVHGALAIRLNTRGAEKRADSSVPCVTFAGVGSWIVQIDGEAMARIAVEELMRQGCKKPGIWTTNTPYVNIPDREPRNVSYQPLSDMGEFQSFRQTLIQHKMHYYEELARQPSLLPPLLHLTLQEQGYMLAQEVFGTFNNTNRPDGLFITNDLLADGALAALNEMGIKVGKDLKIVTATNAGSPILFGHLKSITTLELNPLDIVHAMFSVLDQLMMGHDPGEVTCVRHQLRQ